MRSIMKLDYEIVVILQALQTLPSKILTIEGVQASGNVWSLLTRLPWFSCDPTSPPLGPFLDLTSVRGVSYVVQAVQCTLSILVQISGVYRG